MKTYLEYLTQVLGVNAVMMPLPLAATGLSAESGNQPAFFYSAAGPWHEGQDFQKIELAIVNWVHEQSESLFDPAVGDLFGKMLAAMKIPAEKVLVLDCVMNEHERIPNELFKICEPQIVLFFATEPTHLGEFQIKGPARWLETLSPAFLLQNPASKKIVWNDMQKVMREI